MSNRQLRSYHVYAGPGSYTLDAKKWDPPVVTDDTTGACYPADPNGGAIKINELVFYHKGSAPSMDSDDHSNSVTHRVVSQFGGTRKSEPWVCMGASQEVVNAADVNKTFTVRTGVANPFNTGHNRIRANTWVYARKRRDNESQTSVEGSNAREYPILECFDSPMHVKHDIEGEIRKHMQEARVWIKKKIPAPHRPADFHATLDQAFKGGVKSKLAKVDPNKVDFMSHLKMALDSDWYRVVCSNVSLSKKASFLALFESFCLVAIGEHAGDSFFDLVGKVSEINERIQKCVQQLSNDFSGETYITIGRAITDGDPGKQWRCYFAAA